MNGCSLTDKFRFHFIQNVFFAFFPIALRKTSASPLEKSASFGTKALLVLDKP
jgi:hypothetical protein